MIHLMLIDDHEKFTTTVAEMLGMEKDIQIECISPNGESALECLEKHLIDIVLLDYRLGDGNMNGLETAEKILSRCPAVEIIFLSAHVPQTLLSKAGKLGIKGFIDKNKPISGWANTIRQVYRQGIMPSVADTRNEKKIIETGDQNWRQLSHTELKVLRLIANGLDTQQIAQELNHRIHTIEVHRRNLMSRLGTFTNASLVREAVRKGILRTD